jgi:hypothetical protein
VTGFDRVNVQQIKDRLTGGFTPFIIRTSDGRSYPVPHPEFVAVGRNVVVVIGRNDRVNTLDALHISGIEDQRSSANGW